MLGSVGRNQRSGAKGDAGEQRGEPRLISMNERL